MNINCLFTLFICFLGSKYNSQEDKQKLQVIYFGSGSMYEVQIEKKSIIDRDSVMLNFNFNFKNLRFCHEEDQPQIDYYMTDSNNKECLYEDGYDDVHITNKKIILNNGKYKCSIVLDKSVNTLLYQTTFFNIDTLYNSLKADKLLYKSKDEKSAPDYFVHKMSTNKNIYSKSISFEIQINDISIENTEVNLLKISFD